MNLFKSLFIILAPTWFAYVVFVAILGLIEQSNYYIYIGMILSALPLLLFLMYILLFRAIARTNIHLFLVSVPSLLGYVIVLASFILKSNPILLPTIIYSMSSFLLTLLYIYWYSNNGREISNFIKNDLVLPQFYLEDFEENKINSQQFIGTPCLILFYRGNWCPLCMAQIDEIIKSYHKFEKLGVKLVFISPQASGNSKKLFDKFKIPVKFYVDKENNAAQQLGISHQFGLPMGFQLLGYESHTVYPTIIATDADGKIVYNDQTSNYRVRPEPKEMLKIFTEITGPHQI